MPQNQTQIDLTGQYSVRAAKPDDYKFIVSTFLKGLYYGDSWFSQIDKDAFMDNYKKVIDGFFRSPQAAIQVACLREDEDTIIGYSITSSDYSKIHWVFVKAAWRRHGIARRLCPQYPETVTHLNTLGKTLLPKVNNPKFNPFF